MSSQRPSSSHTILDLKNSTDHHQSLDQTLSSKDDQQERPLSLGTISTLDAPVWQEKSQTEITYPDGGWRAWLTVIGVCIVQFSTFGYTNAFGAYQDFYVRIFLNNKTSSQISWIGSTQLSLILCMGLLTGAGFDKGYYYHMMFGGVILITSCLVMLSFCHPHQYYAVFLCHGLGIGVGNGLTYVPSVSLISHYFRRRRTLALGITAAGSSLGGLIHPIILNHLLHGSIGFHNGVRISAALNFSLLTIAMMMMRPRLPPSGSKRILPNLGKFIRDPPYVGVVIGTMFTIFGMYFPIFFFQLYAVKHGISPHLSFFAVTIMNGGNLVGRIVPNLVAHRFGELNLSILSTTSSGVLTFAMLGVHNFGGVLGFGSLFGFFTGAFISLLPPLVATISDDVSEVGARLGVCVGVAGIAALVGAPISGALLSTKYVWWRPTTLAGVCIFAGTVSLIVAKHLVKMRTGKQEKEAHSHACVC